MQMWSRLIKNYTYIGLLQVNLAGELFANLIERTSGPITEPVEDTSEMKQAGIVSHWKKSQMKKPNVYRRDSLTDLNMFDRR